MKRQNLYPILFILVLTLMTIFSIRTIGTIKPLNIVSTDKILHCSAYFLLFVLFIQSVNQWPGTFVHRHRYWIGIPFCWCFGLGMEFAQLYLTHGRREFDLYDQLANTVGIVLGIIVALLVEKYWRQIIKLLRIQIMTEEDS